jgi:hypothetical protein
LVWDFKQIISTLNVGCILFWVQQGKPKDFFDIVGLTTMGSNPIRPCLINARESNKNQMVPHHIQRNRKRKKQMLKV